MAIKLTAGQQKALDVFVRFCLDESQTANNRLVVAGYAGTGKTELVSNAMQACNQAAELKNNILVAAGKTAKEYPQFFLTATTNKAAEALQEATNANILEQTTAIKRSNPLKLSDPLFNVPWMQPYNVTTIHSLLGIRPFKDHATNTDKISDVTKPDFAKRPSILIIDEASFIDETLLSKLNAGVHEYHKIVYVGDPAQLSPVKSSSTPVFDQKYLTVYLTEVVRQQPDNQIINVSTAFRNKVNGEAFTPFNPDQNKVIHLDNKEFNATILEEFGRKDYLEKDAKVLAWRNSTVKQYNSLVKEHLTGHQELKSGDYAVCNQYFESKKKSVKTDAVVQITSIDGTWSENRFPAKIGKDSIGIDCYNVSFTCGNKSFSGLMPLNPVEYKQAIHDLAVSKIRGIHEWSAEFQKKFVDLRPMYACTVNKSQGSTYKKVFIDLNDIGACRQSDQVNRMLYVSFSRASDQVVLTGDIRT